MRLDAADTIVAIASARGASERGMIRLSGPDALAIARRLSQDDFQATRPTRLGNRSLRCVVDGAERSVPADLFVWPNQRSYTGQPSIELHTVGSPPILDALVRACLEAGARLAEPGEFTLRAVLAGRIDLTQAEAVLSVIDADSEERLAAALEQLAGGLSTPLHRLRADLLGLLADLEAGLDFVEEEDVRFVEPEELRRRLAEAAELVAQTERQLATRGTADRLPRVAIVGPPNVGKSSLFNALVERYGDSEREAAALVADQPGVTRDAIQAAIEASGVRFLLIDTAGDDAGAAIDAIDAAARGEVTSWRQTADVLVACDVVSQTQHGDETIAVRTQIDGESPRLAPSAQEYGVEPKALASGSTPQAIPTSAITGEGLEPLATTIAERLAQSANDTASLTAERCGESLRASHAALARAAGAAASDAGEELVSLELREALDGLGRVVGEVVTDEVLEQIFSRFCIGK